ncbi:SDR family oxidoreductase [Nocardiopsis baichengensis]|uniref:SDR family oxidoreductase n=1 Tax=Nocardiopsis baichengensis TaxID=280240 RepID=UPI00037AB443|nr:SDR family oxidoreductase [Nocardiopsis baichengensis]
MTAEQRWALVTGASRRTGAHLARTLAAHGYHLHLHSNASASDVLERALSREHGIRVIAHHYDLTDTSSIDRWAHELANGPYPPRLVVNNASVFPEPHAVNDTAALQESLAVHLLAPAALTAALLPGGGHIVNLLDARLRSWDAIRPGYELAKHALAAHTRLAAKQLAPRVRVNAIAPGLLLPPPGKDQAHLDGLARQRSPMGVPARLEDVASALLFLEKAVSITGEIIHVDGGEHLGPKAGAQRLTAWQTESTTSPDAGLTSHKRQGQL